MKNFQLNNKKYDIIIENTNKDNTFSLLAAYFAFMEYS